MIWKARAYDPALGRFLQPDPAGSASDVNPYAYGGGSPVNVTDPTGMTCSGNGSTFVPDGNGGWYQVSDLEICAGGSGVGLGPGLLVSGPGRYATSPGGAGFGMNGGRSITQQPQNTQQRQNCANMNADVSNTQGNLGSYETNSWRWNSEEALNYDLNEAQIALDEDNLISHGSFIGGSGIGLAALRVGAFATPAAGVIGLGVGALGEAARLQTQSRD